jgi:hypothetical protein
METANSEVSRVMRQRWACRRRLGWPAELYHYFDYDPGRRSITEKMTSAEALARAKAAARDP